MGIIFNYVLEDHQNSRPTAMTSKNKAKLNKDIDSWITDQRTSEKKDIQTMTQICEAKFLRRRRTHRDTFLSSWKVSDKTNKQGVKILSPQKLKNKFFQTSLDDVAKY